MKRSGVVAVGAVCPWILVVWEPVVLESVVWILEEANFLVHVGFRVDW
jgi:hypothetical protein